MAKLSMCVALLSVCISALSITNTLKRARELRIWREQLDHTQHLLNQKLDGPRRSHQSRRTP